MLPNFVIENGTNWFVYACTGCGTEVRFGPYDVEKGTEQFQLEQSKTQEDLRSKRWSSTLKCPKCQARRIARQSRRNLFSPT